MAYLTPIGVRLKAMREEWNVPAKGLAEAAGVSYSTITSWENGQAPNTSLDVAMRVATALGVTLNDLVQDVEMPDDVRVAEESKRRLSGPARRGERPYADPKYARWVNRLREERIEKDSA